MSGKLVKVESNTLVSGRSPINTGRTKNSDKLINGKVRVYMDDGRNILVQPSRIIFIGLYD